MNPRENFMAVYKCEQPDYYGDIRPAIVFPQDPIRESDSVLPDGLEHTDSWGTVCILLPGLPGKHPRITRDNAVVKDITKWSEQLLIPLLDSLDWSKAEEQARDVNRSEHFVGFFSAQGLFERSHFLMGMEDALCAYLEEPESMIEMLSVIKDFKIATIKEAARHIQPDVILFQDDWGSKQNLFLPPEVWRKIIKPFQREIVQMAHDCGMLFIHHADCICAPIVEDMVEVGIDMWQGAIAQNDIPGIQRRTQGKLAIAGGIDAPAVDIAGITEGRIRSEVRRCIDTYCPAGRFYPSTPNTGCFREWNNSIVYDELEKYGRIWAQEHPITQSGGLPRL